MKTKILMNKVKTLSLITLLAITLSAPSYAASKQKPPTAATEISMSWYQPVLDFFNI